MKQENPEMEVVEMETTDVTKRNLCEFIFSIVAKVLCGLQIVAAIGSVILCSFYKFIPPALLTVLAGVSVAVVIGGLLQGWMLFAKKKPSFWWLIGGIVAPVAAGTTVGWILIAFAPQWIRNILSVEYSIAIAAVVAVLCAVPLILLCFNNLRALKITVSIVSSLALLLVYGYGIWYVCTFEASKTKIDTTPDTEVVPVVPVEVREEPFIIFLSGMDNTAGANYIADRGLSDVNMIIAVDPEEHKILMVSIPRDYYLPLNGDEAKMDKLTHAGSYGVGCSMETLAAAFDLQFNYYVKVNFKSLHDIVNAVDGITVNSEIAFTSSHSYTKTEYTFTKGVNQLTGDSALAFVRERKSIKGGDLQRNKHQQMVISAIINKAISPSIILNPNKLGDVLTAVAKNTKTNISQEEIDKLCAMQLEEMPAWDISAVSVVGKGAYRPCYAAGGQELSVVLPDEASMNEAITALQQFKVTK